MAVRTPKRKRARIVLVFALVAVGGATMGFRYTFPRQGEAALRFIPADAYGFAVFDLQPSWRQLSAFSKVNGAMDGGDVKDGVRTLLGDAPWVKEVAPHLGRSAAAAWIPGRDPSGAPVFLVGLRNPGAVEESLTRLCRRRGSNFELPTNHAPLEGRVIDDLLVMGIDAESVDRVATVQSGKSASIESVAEYRAAREAIDGDANMMLFVSTAGFRQMSKSAGGSQGEALSAGGFFGFGLAVRDEGLSASCTLPITNPDWRPYKLLAGLQPVRKDLLDRVPSGAYDVFAVSQPATLFEATEAALPSTPSTTPAFADMEKELSRETGIGLRDQLLPALKGNAIYASYPSGNAVEGYDVLMIVDDANGANPEQIAEALTRYLERKLREDGKPGPERLFDETQRNGVETHLLTPEMRREMIGEAAQSMDPTGRRLVENKTVGYAIVGKAVIAASSEQLLDRAVATYSGGGQSLADSGLLRETPGTAVESPNLLYRLDPVRVAEGIRNSIRPDAVPGNARQAYDSFFESFKKVSQPLALAIQCDQRGLRASIFVPLDYKSLADAVRKAEGASSPGALNVVPGETVVR